MNRGGGDDGLRALLQQQHRRLSCVQIFGNCYDPATKTSLRVPPASPTPGAPRDRPSASQVPLRQRDHRRGSARALRRRSLPGQKIQSLPARAVRLDKLLRFSGHCRRMPGRVLGSAPNRLRPDSRRDEKADGLVRGPPQHRHRVPSLALANVQGLLLPRRCPTVLGERSSGSGHMPGVPGVRRKLRQRR